MKGCRKMSILTYWEHDEGISKLAEYAVRREISFLLSVPDFLPVLRLQEAVCLMVRQSAQR